MPRSLLDIPGKDRKQRIWVAQFENGGCILLLSYLPSAVPTAFFGPSEVFQFGASQPLPLMQAPPAAFLSTLVMYQLATSEHTVGVGSGIALGQAISEISALFAGECVSEVERSLIYCKSHKIPNDCNNPEHERPVFRKALLQRWKVHFAHMFQNLASSQKVLAQVRLHILCNVHLCIVFIAARLPHGPACLGELQLCL